MGNEEVLAEPDPVEAAPLDQSPEQVERDLTKARRLLRVTEVRQLARCAERSDRVDPAFPEDLDHHVVRTRGRGRLREVDRVLGHIPPVAIAAVSRRELRHRAQSRNVRTHLPDGAVFVAES